MNTFVLAKIKPLVLIAAMYLFTLPNCSGSSQFTGWQTEEFGKTPITGSTSKTIKLVNPSHETEQHIRAIAFDRGSNAAGNFRINRLTVGNENVDPTDIVVPPGKYLSITVTYAPRNLKTSEANYGGWKTGDANKRRWIPIDPDKVNDIADDDTAIHRAIIEAVYDYPDEGIYFIQLVGEAIPGPNGEENIGAGGGTCTPGNGIMCYTGGFSIDIPALSPGGPKNLELSGPIPLSMNGSSIKLRMDDFPYAILHLSSADTPHLPSGVTISIIINGSEGVEAAGTFDGSRLTIEGVSFRIRAALGDYSAGDVENGISALVDFDISDLKIETVSPLQQGQITLRINAKIPNNASGNELFDQFMSNVDVTVTMQGHLEY